MNLSRKTFIKSILNVVGFTVTVPFVFADNSPKHNISDISLEQKKEFVKLINESFKKLGFQFKDCEGNCEKIFTAIENSLNHKHTSLEDLKLTQDFYERFAEGLKNNISAKDRFIELVTSLSNDGGRSSEEDTIITRNERLNKNNIDWFLFQERVSDRANSDFAGDRKTYIESGGTNTAEATIVYVKDLSDLKKNGKVEHNPDVTRENFDATKYKGRSLSDVKFVNDELAMLMEPCVEQK
jgi:hypothetical protein